MEGRSGILRLLALIFRVKFAAILGGYFCPYGQLLLFRKNVLRIYCWKVCFSRGFR